MWKVIRSVLAAFLGVQREDRRREDFEKGSPLAFIVVGLLLGGCSWPWWQRWRSASHAEGQPVESGVGDEPGRGALPQPGCLYSVSNAANAALIVREALLGPP